MYITDRIKRKKDITNLADDTKRIKAYLNALSSDNKIDIRKGIDRKDDDNKIKQSKRRLECLNEFTNNERIIASSFFHIFLLGKCFGINGSLSPKERKQVLLQYTGHAASNHSFLFFIFDQMQRHSNITGINAVVRNHKQCFRTFTKLVKKKGFKKLIMKALKNPEGKTAKAIMKIVSPVLMMGGKGTSLGSLERNETVSKINSLCLRYGMPTLFLTIAIDDVNNFNS